VFLHSAHMPWLANTFWQLLLSLDLFCCRHCWTALSLPSCCRQKRDASRLQACCSCGVPMWLWASEDEMPDSSTRMATTYRMTISRERPSLKNDLGGVASWSIYNGRAGQRFQSLHARAPDSLDYPARSHGPIECDANASPTGQEPIKLDHPIPETAKIAE